MYTPAPRLYGPLAAVRSRSVPAGDHRHDRRSRAGHPMRASVPVHPRRKAFSPSFVYVNIICALAVAFRHIGKAVAVDSGDHQIPGAAGLYPIEMMPEFFRRLKPFLPVHLRHQRDARADRRHVCQTIIGSTCSRCSGICLWRCSSAW